MTLPPDPTPVGAMPAPVPPPPEQLQAIKEIVYDIQRQLIELQEKLDQLGSAAH